MKNGKISIVVASALLVFSYASAGFDEDYAATVKKVNSQGLDREEKREAITQLAESIEDRPDQSEKVAKLSFSFEDSILQLVYDRTKALATAKANSSTPTTRAKGKAALERLVEAERVFPESRDKDCLLSSVRAYFPNAQDDSSESTVNYFCKSSKTAERTAFIENIEITIGDLL